MSLQQVLARCQFNSFGARPDIDERREELLMQGQETVQLGFVTKLAFKFFPSATPYSSRCK